jgi:hypothetical protein
VSEEGVGLPDKDPLQGVGIQGKKLRAQGKRAAKWTSPWVKCTWKPELSTARD